MKRLALLLAALALSGCGTARYLENRIACSGEQAMVVSMWGLIGIASDVRPEDAKRACRS